MLVYASTVSLSLSFSRVAAQSTWPQSSLRSEDRALRSPPPPLFGRPVSCRREQTGRYTAAYGPGAVVFSLGFGAGLAQSGLSKGCGAAAAIPVGSPWCGCERAQLLSQLSKGCGCSQRGSGILFSPERPLVRPGICSLLGGRSCSLPQPLLLPSDRCPPPCVVGGGSRLVALLLVLSGFRWCGRTSWSLRSRRPQRSSKAAAGAVAVTTGTASTASNATGRRGEKRRRTRMPFG